MKTHICIIWIYTFLYIKTNVFYKNIAEDVETRFNTSKYELYRPLPKGKNKEVIGIMEDELGNKSYDKILLEYMQILLVI